MSEEFLTPAQAAARYGLSLRTIQRHLTAGTLPAFRIGKKWFIKRADLEQTYRPQTPPPVSPAPPKKKPRRRT